MYRIALVGAGNIGSRHLQGLSRSNHDLAVYVYDININSLAVARQRWTECNSTSNHEIFYINDLNELPNRIDICIISTNSNVRYNLLVALNNITTINYLILEKVLLQTIMHLDNISKLCDQNKTWVNTNFREIELLKKVKSEIDYHKKIHLITKASNWGLACNMIHFLDWFHTFNDFVISDIDTSGLNDVWHRAKRDGFYEIFGTIKVYYSNGSLLELTANGNNDNLLFTIMSNKFKWNINLEKGLANSDNKVINSKVLLQSEKTGIIVDDLLSNGKCLLPKIDESVKLHKAMISSLLAHWNKHMPSLNGLLPIT